MKIICPKCKNEKTKKRGLRHTQNRGKIQRYECKSCKHSFVKDDGFYRMRNAPKKITLCLDLFFRGLSTREIQQHLKAFYPSNSSWVSVYKWIIKYSLVIGSFTDKLKINSGIEVQIDEMEYKTRGKISYFIDCIDAQTRYMVHSKYVSSRGQLELKRFLRKIKQRTNSKLKIVTTDGFLAYKNIVKKTFGFNNKLRKNNVEHNVVNASKGEGFNYKIERLHNSIRHRTKTFRGFHAFGSAQAIMKGYEIYYNFIRKHQAIGCCPYQLATGLRLDSVNKWIELIALSKSKDF